MVKVRVMVRFREGQSFLQLRKMDNISQLYFMLHCAEKCKSPYKVEWEHFVVVILCSDKSFTFSRLIMKFKFNFKDVCG